MRFAVLSDTHYISADALFGADCRRELLRRDINRATFAALEKRADIDTVLITGDLTDDGDMDSHVEFTGLLRSLKNSGKNVCVLTATHDFHFSHAWVNTRGWPVSYKKQPWERPWFDVARADYKSLVTEEFAALPPEDCAPRLRRVAFPDELWELYREFGRDQAFSVCDSAYSYAVKLDEKTWCLMLNNNFRDVDANLDFSPTYSPACFRWIEGIVHQAKEEGAFVFACTHHPLAPPVPAYKIGGTRRNMRGPTVLHTLADIGVELVFSGHTHFMNVTFGSSDSGNVLCNVTTPALTFLPPAYRIAELNAAEKTLKLTAVPAEKPEGTALNGGTLREHFINEFVDDQRRKFEKRSYGKLLLGLELRHLYPLCRKASGLTAAEYEEIKNRKFFDIAMELAVNMQTGDGRYTPDTPVYRFMMGLCAVLDSMIAAQPFYPLEKKLEGYTLSQIIEPMLCKNGVPDGDGEFRFDRLPAQSYPTPAFSSRAGDALLVLLTAVAAAVSPLSPAVTALAVPALALRKKKKISNNPYRPERY